MLLAARVRLAPTSALTGAALICAALAAEHADVEELAERRRRRLRSVLRGLCLV